MLNNVQVEMRALAGRVTNVSVREDECLKNRAIHRLKDRVECSKLETTIVLVFENFPYLMHHPHFSNIA